MREMHENMYCVKCLQYYIHNIKLEKKLFQGYFSLTCKAFLTLYTSFVLLSVSKQLYISFNIFTMSIGVTAAAIVVKETISEKRMVTVVNFSERKEPDLNLQSQANYSIQFSSISHFPTNICTNEHWYCEFNDGRRFIIHLMYSSY